MSAFRLRFLAPFLAGAACVFITIAARAADPMPMLVLDDTAKTAHIVDTNDPAQVATVSFTGASALRKGSFHKVYRTTSSIFYLVTVADGAGHLLSQRVEYRLSGPQLPVGPANYGTLPVSNSAVNFSVTCNGKYIVVCGDGPTPVSVINATTGDEVDTLALPNGVANVFCAQDDTTVLAIEMDAFGAGLGVRRLTIDAAGQLTDTAEFLNLPGAYAVIGVPGTGFGVALNRTPMTDSATAFTFAGMTSNGGVPLTGETAESLAFSCGGTSLVIRSRVTGAPIESASLVEVFGFDANTGTITAPASFSFPVAAAGALPAPGLNLVNITTDGALIAAAEQGAVKLYSAADGAFVREFALMNLSAGDVSFLSCCQFINVNPPIDEQVIAGPDVNNDMAIDTEIPVQGTAPSSYTIRINLNVTSPIPSIVIEQVGPAWDVLTVTADMPTDRVFKFPGLLGSFFRWPTYLIWLPSGNNGSLTFDIRNRRNLFPPTYLPNAAGPVPQTVGAKVLYPDFQPVVDDFGNPVVGTAYSVNGVAPAARKR